MKRFSRSVAVVIGIDHYSEGIPELRNACRDARAVAEVLSEKHGYQVLPPLLDNVTRDHILEMLTSLKDKFCKDDRLIFYFAGHGLVTDDVSGFKGYLVPSDARLSCEGEEALLSMDLLRRRLEDLSCHHRLVILDCCFAGSFRWSATRHFEYFPERVYSELYERFVHDPAWQVLTSAAHDQRANDALWGVGQRGEVGEHSPFAAALLEGLHGAADLVPKNGDGLITLTELYLYLRQRVEPATLQQGRRQTPGLWTPEGYDKGEYVFAVPGRAMELPPAPELTEGNNPYRGLQSFELEHEALFFGRTDLLEELRTLIDEHFLTVIVGASGVGKSSLLRAGLAPSLLREPEIELVGPLRFADLTPAILCRVLDTSDSNRVEGSAEVLWQDCGLAVDRWTKAHPERRLVLAIDQLEEAVTRTHQARWRSCEEFLQAAFVGHPSRLRIVVTIRSELEPLLEQGCLKEQWEEGRVVVPSLTHRQLRQVILGPANERLIFFEDGLVDALIEEVMRSPGALPLLSFTLRELYRTYVKSRRTDRTLTWSDYEELGRVEGSLRGRAEKEYVRSRARGQQLTLQRVLLRLISQQGGAARRRRAPRHELIYADETENLRVVKILGRWVLARLIVEDRGFVELAHDKLISAWTRLGKWLDEERDDLLLQRQVRQASDDWHEHRGRLWWHHPRLLQLRDPSGRPKAWLNQRELTFYRKSLRWRRWVRGIAIGSLSSLVALITWATLASRENASLRVGAVIQRLTEEAQRQLSTSGSRRRPHRALLLARQAHDFLPRAGLGYRSRVDATLREALGRSLPSRLIYRADVPLDPLIFSPVESLLIAGLGAEILLIEIGESEIEARRLDPKAGEVTALGMSDDGTLLVSGHVSGRLCVWQPAARSLDRPRCVDLQIGGASITDLVFGSSSHRLIVAQGGWNQGLLRFFDLDPQAAEDAPIEPSAEVALTFRPTALTARKGDQLLVAGAGKRLLRMSSRDPQRRPEALPGFAEGAGFRWLRSHPELTWLAGLSLDDRLLVWLFDRGPMIVANQVTALAFPSGGEWGVLAGSDGRLSWYGEVFKIRGSIESWCEGPVEDAASSSDGSLLAISCDDAIRLWRLAALKAETKPFESRLEALQADEKSRLARLSGDELAVEICQTVRRNLSLSDWRRYVGSNRPYERTCPELAAHPSVLMAGEQGHGR